MGFCNSLMGLVAGVGVGALGSKLPRSLKWIMFSLFVVGAIANTYYVVTLVQWPISLPHTFPLIWLGAATGAVMNSGAAALMSELAVELTYPIPEAVATSFLSTAIQVFYLAFLATSLFVHSRLLLFVFLICQYGMTFFVLLVRPRHVRHQIDFPSGHTPVRDPTAEGYATLSADDGDAH